MKKIFFTIFVAILWFLPSSASAAEYGCTITVSQSNYNDNPGCLEENSDVVIRVNNATEDGEVYSGRFIAVIGTGNNWQIVKNVPGDIANGYGAITSQLSVNADNNNVNISIVKPGSPSPVGMCHTEKVFVVKPACTEEERGVVSTNEIPLFFLCDHAGKYMSACLECIGDNSQQDKRVWTALGCIETDPKEFVKDFLTIAIGIAGGIALLLMVYGAFLISISTGDPKKAEEGKEMITGTIAGLLFIIFSVFLLKLIGVDILDIPGF